MNAQWTRIVAVADLLERVASTFVQHHCRPRTWSGICPGNPSLCDEDEPAGQARGWPADRLHRDTL